MKAGDNAEVRQALSEAAALFTPLKELSRNDASVALFANRKHLEPLEQAVSENPTFAPLFQDALLIGASVSGRLLPFEVAAHLVRSVLAGSSVDETISALAQFVATPETECLSVMCLYGVDVGEPIQINERLSIVDPAALPPSRHKESLFETSRVGPLSLPQASAAIIYKANIKPAIAPLTAAALVRTGSLVEEASIQQNLALAAACIAANGPIQGSNRFQIYLHPGYPSDSGGIALGEHPSRLFGILPNTT
ncbi:MAG: hypothetical protein ABUS57_02420, partial [Pseudomonadota bacterium]